MEDEEVEDEDVEYEDVEDEEYEEVEDEEYEEVEDEEATKDHGDHVSVEHGPDEVREEVLAHEGLEDEDKLVEAEEAEIAADEVTFERPGEISEAGCGRGAGAGGAARAVDVDGHVGAHRLYVALPGQAA